MSLRNLLLLLTAAGCGLLAACDQIPSSRHGKSDAVAIIDFPALLRATGMDEQVQGQLQDANRILEQQLQQATLDLSRQVTDARDAAGEKPTPEQVQELEALTAQANLQLNQVRQNAQLKFQQVQAGVIAQLRDQVRPIAQAIAARHGAKAVLLSSESILWFDPSADITAEVIAEVRIHPLTLAPLPPGPDQEKAAGGVDAEAGSDASSHE